MGAQRPASEDPGLGGRAAAGHLPRRGDGAREVKQLSTFQINFFSTFNFLKSSKSKFNCLHEMERKPEILPSQLSPGIILMSGGAHDGGMLQS